MQSFQYPIVGTGLRTVRRYKAAMMQYPRRIRKNLRMNIQAQTVDTQLDFGPIEVPKSGRTDREAGPCENGYRYRADHPTPPVINAGGEMVLDTGAALRHAIGCPAIRADFTICSPGYGELRYNREKGNYSDISGGYKLWLSLF